MKDWDVAEEPVSELKWTQLLTQKVFTKSYFMEMKGEELTVEWAKRTGFRHPVLVKVADEGLDLSMPDSSLTVSQVANLVDPDRRVEVLQVSTQSSTTMTLQEWADYYHLPPQQRPRILNVISLEVSETKLGNLVKPPKFVRDIDWTEQVWPKSLKPSHYPKVQMYCLMSVKNSFTDFHIDFGGSSVYYHLVKGRKIFYFVPPTKHNLAKYTDWSSSSNQSTRFFADEVQECVEVVLEEGNT